MSTHRDPNSKRSLAFYRFAHWVVVTISTKPWRVVVRGAERVPAAGPFIFAPSHRSMLDIPWTAKATKLRIRFMGKATLFRVPVLGWFFTTLGGFAVERDGNDRAPLRDSLVILANGEVLAVYPEGTRQRGPIIQELQRGAAYLSIKAQVPLVPLALAGTEDAFRSGRRLPRFGRGLILVGEPIQPPTTTGSRVKRELVDELNAELRLAMQKLYDEATAMRDELNA